MTAYMVTIDVIIVIVWMILHDECRVCRVCRVNEILFSKINFLKRIFVNKVQRHPTPYIPTLHVSSWFLYTKSKYCVIVYLHQIFTK